MDVMNKKPEFKALEQKLPDLCIDRLEYNLHTGYIFNLLTKEEIQDILTDVEFDGENWYFKTPSIAKKFASLSLHFTEDFWGCDWHLGIYRIAAQAFKRALNLKIVSFDQLHFSTDKAVLEQVKNKDSSIDQLFYKCAHHEKYIQKGTPEDHNFFVRPKFRGINPLVKVENKFYRLTSLDNDFATEYVRIKQKVKIGHYLKLDIDI